MTLYPEVQRKAQAEIDAVVGNDRLPEFADRVHLPYINAVALEALRWHTGRPIPILLLFQILDRRCSSCAYRYVIFSARR